MNYKNITIGGTFDHFHKGHEAMLTRAFELGETVWLGITTDEFVKDKFQVSIPRLRSGQGFKFQVETFAARKKSVEQFLHDQGWSDVHIVPIADRFGSTLTDETLAAIVVSPETEPVAHEINKLRAQKNWAELEVIRVEWVLAKDGKPIHSTRIRAGVIDRSGFVYGVGADWGVRQLPEDLRDELKKPLGMLIADTSKEQQIPTQEILKQVQDDKTLIAVGDAVTSAFLQAGVIPQVSIVDLHIQRQLVYKTLAEFHFPKTAQIKHVTNPAGVLSFESWDMVSTMLQAGQFPAVLEVLGEEDLFTLFAILAAPLGSLVVYGQPNQGIVVVEVSEEKKREIQRCVDRFKSS